MKKNVCLKILMISIMTMIVAFSLSNSVFAAITMDPNSVSGNMTSGAATSIGNVVSMFLGIIQVVAMGVAVIMLIVLAIKYVSAAPSEKADIKKGMITYVVGAVLLFGATGILQIIKSFAQTIQ